ncbi:MAG: hypothetical protein HYX41_07405 [Bdellovibrio sp.]|nr:hypothetical protein [Bdellovibrio sp.]
MLGICQPAEGRFDPVPGTRYQSAQNAAMADGNLPLGDDSAAGLFQNPALLGKSRKSEFQPINFGIYGDMALFNNITSATNFLNLPSYASVLQSSPGTSSGMGVSFVPTFSLKGIAVGVLVQGQFVASANADGTLNYRTLYQVIPAVGTGFRLLNGAFRIGYSLQWVNQASGTFTNVAVGSASFNSGLFQGAGFSHTLGAALILPTVMLPSFDFVVRNALNTAYTTSTFLHVSSGAVGAPATETMSFDGSFSLHPRLGQGAVLNLIVVERDLTNVSGATASARLVVGAEMNLRDRVYLRGGYGGGYPAFGLGLRSSRGAELSFSWYTEETGTISLSAPDTRVLMQYKIRSF